MRTLDHRRWSTALEDYDSQRKAGRYNAATTLTYQLPGQPEYTVTIGAGRNDELGVFHEAGMLYVLATNDPLGYVGLEAFYHGEAAGDAFAQNYGELGAYLLALSPIYRAKRLAEYIYGD